MAFDAIGVKWFFVAGHVTRLSAGQRPLRCQLLFELFIEETTKRRSSFKLFIYCSGRLVLIELMVRNEPVVWPCRSNGDIAIDLIVVLWTGTMKCNSLKPLPSNWSMTTSTDVPPPLSLSLSPSLLILSSNAQTIYIFLTFTSVLNSNSSYDAWNFR